MMASLEDVVAGAIPNVGDCFPKGSDNTQTKDSDRLLKAAPQSSPDQEDCPEIEIVFQQLPGNAKIMRRSPLTTFPMPCFLLEKKVHMLPTGQRCTLTVVTKCSTSGPQVGPQEVSKWFYYAVA